MAEGLAEREWRQAFSLGGAIFSKSAMDLEYINEDEAEKIAHHAADILRREAAEAGLELEVEVAQMEPEDDG